MKIKIFRAERKIAKGQIHPVDLAKKELADLGYEVVKVKDKADIAFVQTHLVRRPRDLEPFAKKAKCPLVLLDDSASTGTAKFGLLRSEHVVAYIKKQLLANKEDYYIKYPRGRRHYYLIAKLAGKNSSMRSDTEESGVEEWMLPRIILGWNLGMMRRPGLNTEDNDLKDIKRDIDIHFSIKTKHISKSESDNLNKIDNHYAYHRVQCGDELDRIADKYNYSMSGRCVGSDYMDKMARSKVCVSPLGLGEICFRDFEAISYGAVLIKPSMSHLATWPDIFRPWETYIPVKWDWSNLEDVISKVLNNYDKYFKVARNAYSMLRYCRRNDIFAKRFDEVMGEVTKLL